MSYGMNGWNKEIPGGDTISRAAAIDALGEKPLAWMESEYAQGLQNQWAWDVNALKALPSAQPKSYREGYQAGFKDAQLERKKGKWINEGVYGEGYAQCSIRCNNPLCNFHYIGYLGDYNFCPNCGADMRGEQNG